MMIIDGSYGEGGGQIVRTAVALSVAFNKPVKIINIRANRKKPGLKHQHLHAIKALAELTGAEVSGLELGSTELAFKPKALVKNSASIKIPTAGSIGLCLQCIVPALMHIKEEVTIKFEGGATCGLNAPPLDYIVNVWFPNMKLWGFTAPEVSIEREGYYPKGGAKASVKIKPSNLHPHTALERGDVLRIRGISHASSMLKKRDVAERQAREALRLLGAEYDVKIKRAYSDSLCPGSSITLWAECENTIIGADSLGQIGVTSEQVARKAVEKLKKEINSNAAFDRHMTDMLIPLMALAGDSSITTNEITSHTKTNIWLCEKFIGKKFKVKGNKIEI